MTYYGKKNAKAIEKTAVEGNLFLFEVEELERENQKLITDLTRKTAYNNELHLRMSQAVGGIVYACKYKNSRCNSSLECLKDAENAIVKAKKSNYDMPTSEFYEGLEKIIGLVKNDYTKSKEVLRYISKSNLELDIYKSQLEEVIPELENQYKKEFLSKVLRNAKSLRKVVRKQGKVVEAIEQYIANLTEIVNLNEIDMRKIAHIRDVAYNRSVEFVLKKAKESLETDSAKAERLLEKAKRNAQILHRNIPAIQ